MADRAAGVQESAERGVWGVEEWEYRCGVGEWGVVRHEVASTCQALAQPLTARTRPFLCSCQVLRRPVGGGAGGRPGRARHTAGQPAGSHRHRAAGGHRGQGDRGIASNGKALQLSGGLLVDSARAVSFFPCALRCPHVHIITHPGSWFFWNWNKVHTLWIAYTVLRVLFSLCALTYTTHTRTHTHTHARTHTHTHTRTCMHDCRTGHGVVQRLHLLQHRVRQAGSHAGVCTWAEGAAGRTVVVRWLALCCILVPMATLRHRNALCANPLGIKPPECSRPQASCALARSLARSALGAPCRRRWRQLPSWLAFTPPSWICRTGTTQWWASGGSSSAAARSSA